MKVLHVITGLDAGGAERSLYNLLRHYPDVGVTHIVCSLGGDGQYGPRIAALGIDVHVPRGFSLPATLPAMVRRERPDIIQGWMYHGNMAALWGATLASSPRPKLLWNVRQCLYDMTQERRTTAAVIRLSARVSRFPRRIIYNSHLAARHHEAIGFSSAGRLIIPNGFDTTLFRPDAGARARIRQELGLPDTMTLIGLIARFHPVKDHASFLAAARLLADCQPGCAFLLAGADTDGPAARAAVEAHGLSGRIHLLGARPDIAAITASLDIAALSSVAEAFPNVVGEAMACAVPCVVTDVGDAAAIISDTGLVVRRNDPELFAQALQAMLVRTDRAELGVKARGRIEKFFSIAATVQMYHKVYETLAASV